MMKPLTDSSCSLEIFSQYGSLRATYEEELGNFTIDYYEVNARERCQGYGKQLLRLANAEACDMGATTITGRITSRESLQAALTVYGHEALTITAPSFFGQDQRPPHLRHGCAATLHYFLY